MTPLGAAHTAIAIVALIAGTAVVIQPKGTRRHKRLGRVYLVSMLLVNGSALLIYRLFDGFGPFHWAALASLAVLMAGIIPALRRSPDWLVRHQFYMSWSYVGLLAATAAEITSRVPGWDFFWSVTLAVSGVVLAGGWKLGWRPAHPALT